MQMPLVPRLASLTSVSKRLGVIDRLLYRTQNLLRRRLLTSANQRPFADWLEKGVRLGEELGERGQVRDVKSTWPLSCPLPFLSLSYLSFPVSPCYVRAHPSPISITAVWLA